MIDITGLREDKRPQSSTIVHALLDRLEAAEKERDELRTELNEIRYGVAVAHDTIKALRTKITEMERQEPVGFLDDNGRAILQRELPPWADLYALPVVAPKLDEIKTALQRAWNKVWSLLGTQGESK